MVANDKIRTMFVQYSSHKDVSFISYPQIYAVMTSCRLSILITYILYSNIKCLDPLVKYSRALIVLVKREREREREREMTDGYIVV